MGRNPGGLPAGRRSGCGLVTGTSVGTLEDHTAGMLREKRQVGEKQTSTHCGCIFCLATPERRGNDYLHLTDQNPKVKTSSHTCWGHMQPEGTERSSASPLPEPREGRPHAESTSWQKPRAPLGFRRPVSWGCLGSTRIQD